MTFSLPFDANRQAKSPECFFYEGKKHAGSILIAMRRKIEPALEKRFSATLPA
jgi:hypothetical protein